jgi:hypothetical protein
MQQQQAQLLRENEKFAFVNESPVESIPVYADEKLSSVAELVGDFSLIPTTAIDLLGLIGTQQLQGIKIPTSTKSAKKGWRLTGKW